MGSLAKTAVRGSGLRGQDLGFRVGDSWGVSGLGLRGQDLGFGLGIDSLGFQVNGFRLRAEG